MLDVPRYCWLLRWRLDPMSVLSVEAPQETWDWIARAVTARRVELGRTQADVVERSDGLLSQSVLSQIENGRAERYRVRSLSGLSRGLDWGADGWRFLLIREDPDEGRRRESGDLRGQSEATDAKVDYLMNSVEVLAAGLSRVAKVVGVELPPLPPPPPD